MNEANLISEFISKYSDGNDKIFPYLVNRNKKFSPDTDSVYYSGPYWDEREIQSATLCAAAEFDSDVDWICREVSALRDSIGEHTDVGHACDTHAADRRSGARKANVERQRKARDRRRDGV